MRLTLEEFKEALAQAHAEWRAEAGRENAEQLTPADLDDNKAARLIEGLSALAGQMEQLRGIVKPHLGPSKKASYKIALTFVDTLEDHVEYVKRVDVLEQLHMLDPRIRGPLAVRFPEMVHQRKP